MRKRNQNIDKNSKRSGSCIHSKASVYHAVVVIFLEFFAFGLLTAPMITILDETFPKHTFLMNGMIQGVKGFLSFLSAPLIGAMSDVFGRKPFLLLTVTFTCSPIPLLKISHWWYFTMVSISGIFAVTFSVVFAYVADVTQEEDRSWAYGLVSATFAASLVISPTIGAYLGKIYSDNFVIALATAVALLDVFFILTCVPESLPENYGVVVGSGKKISWEKADPFGALRRIGNDYLIMMLCIATFLSYLPEAGQYSCFFVYLRLVLDFSEESVALFIGFVGIFSCIAQTALLTVLMTYLGPKQTIIVGLGFEALQLSIYGFGNKPWMMWMAGGIASLGSITYPAISAFVSKHAEADQQGVAQGVLTGIRGLCNGLGPAMFGFVFYLFQVDLTGQGNNLSNLNVKKTNATNLGSIKHLSERILPGPPFAFGSLLVLLAILVSILIPNNPHAHVHISQPSSSRRKINYVAVNTTNIVDEEDDPLQEISDEGFETQYLRSTSELSGVKQDSSATPCDTEALHIDITDRVSSNKSESSVLRVDEKKSKSLQPRVSVTKKKESTISRGLKYLKIGSKQATS